MLEVSYVLIFVLLVILVYCTIRKVLLQNGVNNLRFVTFQFIAGVIIWLVYLYFISFNGFLFDKTLPPKFLIFVFIPVILIMVYFFNLIKKSKLYEWIPKSWPIYYQSFRVAMEVIILMTFKAGIIPIQATFQGYNFEIVFAITAPIIGYFTFVKPVFSKRIAIIWNVVGIVFLLVVVSIMVSSFFIPEIWGSKQVLIDIRFTQLPLILLPAFMVPSAIFMHIFSIVQIQKSL